MHRQKTKLARRAHRVASALERRGIVATYELHDRVLSNRSSRRRFAQHRPELDELQRDILQRLGKDGYAVVPFADLVPGMSAVTKLAPVRVTGLMMGLWYLGISVGNFIGGRLASLYGSMPLTTLFGIIGAVGIGAGLLMFALTPPIKRLMGDVN